jgi:TonB-linked SusC/RagA family outer membrane protein
MPGVNIIQVGTSNGVVTNFDGEFVIDAPPDAVLQFSYVGYVVTKIEVDGRTNLEVIMEPSASALDEVVVIGYGTQKKLDMTSAVSSITGERVAEAPMTNISNSLVGLLPGLTAVNMTGEPGSGSQISIRGVSTMGDNSTLVLVDGIERGFEFINPNEIESISILKDASATAVYGSRAANGVILITTKRGISGKPVFSYNSFVGVQQPTQYPDVMNAYEYAITKNQASENLGNPTIPYSEEIMEDIRLGRIPGTDWYNLTFKDNPLQIQQNISVRGGSDAIKYYLSLGHMDQDGMYDNINFKKYSIRSNVDANINDNLTISASIDANRRLQNGSAYSSGQIFREAVASYPLDLPYNPDGTVYYTVENHPVEMTKTGYSHNKANELQTTLSITQEIPTVKGLSLSGRASFGREDNNNKHYNVPIFMNRQDEAGNTLEIYPNGGYNGKIGLNQAFSEYVTTTLNASANYKHSFKNHDVDALVLFEQFEAKANNFNGFRTNFPAEGLDELFWGGESEKDANGGSFVDARRGFVARINYAYKKRYLFGASFRRDGSVAFPYSNKYGNFPAISAGWRIDEEAFIQNNSKLDFIDNLKFRVSYGEVGNDRNVYNGRTPTFQYSQTYTPAGVVVSGSEGLSTITPGVLPNPNVTWETANITDLGLETSMWNGKLRFEGDVFYKRTSNILLQRIRSIPSTLGATLPAENYAIVDNKGIELSLSHKNTIGELYYYVRANASFSKNEVIILDEPANIPDYLLQTGRTLGFRTGYKTIGYFQSEEEVDAYLPQFNGGQTAGDVKYADINGDGTVDANDQEIISMNNSIPKVLGGLSFGGSFKGFDLAVLFQGAAKVNRMLNGAARDFLNGGSNNMYSALLDYWTPENRDAAYPRPWEGYHPNNSLTSSLYLRDASYIRLKSVNIGYTMPSGIINALSLDHLRFYLAGSNLFTMSKMKMFDPEMQGSNGAYYPQQRTFNLGVNLSF